MKEWFTAAMEVEDGKVVSTYCNVAKPTLFKNEEISFVDLDLDFIQEKNNQWTVVNEDEFELNSIKYGYPKELKVDPFKIFIIGCDYKTILKNFISKIAI